MFNYHKQSWIKCCAFCLLVMSACAQAAEFSSSIITPQGFGPQNHASTLVELPDKKIFVCWYSGSREGAQDTQIVCSKSVDGKTWLKPTAAVKAAELPSHAWIANKFLGNPVLTIDDEGNVWLFYTAVPLFGWSAGRIEYKVSHDQGKTWSDSKILIGEPGNLTKNKPVYLGENRFFLPLYRERFIRQGYGCLIQIKQNGINKTDCFDIPKTPYVQPTFVRLNQDNIVAYLRAKKSGHICYANFNLKTNQWSTPEILSLPNPDSGLDAVLGPKQTVILIYNDSTSVRNPLSIAISRTGKDFCKLADLENDMSSSFSYPAVIKSNTGDYLITYTYRGRTGIKFVRLPTAWIQSKLANCNNNLRSSL